MAGTCGMHGRDEKWIQHFSKKTCIEETTWETLVWMGG